MRRRKISYRLNSEFGVQVALISVVSLGGMKTSTAGRRRATVLHYNRRPINDLGNQAVDAKMEHYFPGYLVGDNVKLIVPEGLKSLAGTP